MGQLVGGAEKREEREEGEEREERREREERSTKNLCCDPTHFFNLILWQLLSFLCMFDVVQHRR